MVHHGIPCYEMQLGDVCLPPNHPDAINCDDSVVFDTFRRYMFVYNSSSCGVTDRMLIWVTLVERAVNRMCGLKDIGLFTICQYIYF